MDIKADGSLDYPDEILAQMDWVIASLHSSLGQNREQITQRLLKAIRNPYVRMIGHPSARQYPNREEVEADWDAVIDAAAEHNTILEINANPLRLDLKPELARMAKDRCVLLSINTDAHRIAHLDLMPYGVTIARARLGGSAASRQHVEAGERLRQWLTNPR